MPDIVGARADAVDGLVSGLGLEPDYELVGPAPDPAIPDLSGRTAQKAEPVLTTIGLAPSFELAGPAPTGSLPADPCHRHPAAI